VPLTTVQAGMLDTTAQYYSFKNRIINGAMVIDQRNAGAAVTLSGTAQYPVDRFGATKDTASAVVTAQRSTIVPSTATFTNSLLWTTSTGASPASGDDNVIRQYVEGFNFADFGFGTSSAQSITLSFWVRSSVTGTYGVSLANNAANRCYMATYVVNAANTWEYKTISVAGDTTGTWVTDNNIGFRIIWDLGSGSSRSIAASSAWGATYGTGLTGGVKLVQTTGATFYITGVQLEKGSTATSFDYRPYGTELALCQRYLPAYIYSSASGTEPVAWVRGGSTASIASTSIYFTVPSRVPPTGVTVSGSYAVSGLSFSTISFSYASITVGGLSLSGGSGMTVNNLYELQCSTSGSRILFTGCEL
jgi:hypothetical protein